jgi:hypothetical protein
MESLGRVKKISPGEEEFGSCMVSADQQLVSTEKVSESGVDPVLVGGLVAFAVVAAVTLGSGSIHTTDDGSAATLIVDAFMFGIAGIVGILIPDQES